MVAFSRPMYSRRWALHKYGSTPAGNLQSQKKVMSLALRDVDNLHHYRCLGGRKPLTIINALEYEAICSECPSELRHPFTLILN